MLFNIIYDVLFNVLFNVCNDACSQYMFCALQELGCSANEKSLERYLGETQKKISNIQTLATTQRPS